MTIEVGSQPRKCNWNASAIAFTIVGLIIRDGIFCAGTKHFAAGALSGSRAAGDKKDPLEEDVQY